MDEDDDTFTVTGVQPLNRYDLGYLFLTALTNVAATLYTAFHDTATLMAINSKALDARKTAKADAKAFENSVLEDLERLPGVRTDG